MLRRTPAEQASDFRTQLLKVAKDDSQVKKKCVQFITVAERSHQSPPNLKTKTQDIHAERSNSL